MESKIEIGELDFGPDLSHLLSKDSTQTQESFDINEREILVLSTGNTKEDNPLCFKEPITKTDFPSNFAKPVITDLSSP